MKVDSDKCVGCGACVSIAPENFKFNDEGKSVVINDSITDEAQEAKEMCPVDAITIESETVEFIQERCIGCGACVSIAPENFKFNDEGRAEMIDSSISDEVYDASSACPVDAININE